MVNGMEGRFGGPYSSWSFLYPTADSWGFLREINSAHPSHKTHITPGKYITLANCKTFIFVNFSYVHMCIPVSERHVCAVPVGLETLWSLLELELLVAVRHLCPALP